MGGAAGHETRPSPFIALIPQLYSAHACVITVRVNGKGLGSKARSSMRANDLFSSVREYIHVLVVNIGSEPHV